MNINVIRIIRILDNYLPFHPGRRASDNHLVSKKTEQNWELTYYFLVQDPFTININMFYTFRIN